MSDMPAVIVLGAALTVAAASAVAIVQPVRRRLPAPLVESLLLAGSVGAACLALWFIHRGDWLAAAVTGLIATVLWAARAEDLGRRPWWTALLVRFAIRVMARRPARIDRVSAARAEVGMTLTELRAEYAQTILDDAARDPDLAEILERLGGDLLATVCELETAGRSAEPTPRALSRYLILTALANSYLANLTEPGTTVPPSPYRAYSQPMLVLAAACQVGTSDRLQTAA
jgi:hypothetical protein